MYIEDFFNSGIKVIGFIIIWIIIGLLLGYIKLERLKEQVEMNDEKISKKKQFRILIKPAVVLFTINIVYWGIICPILNKINI